MKFEVKDTIITTERLVLRGFNSDDLNDFYEYSSVEGVGEAAGWKHHESIEDTKKILESFLKHDDCFAICDRETGKLIGSFGVHDSFDTKLTEEEKSVSVMIGYVLSRDYWGKGLMTEAGAAIIDYLFSNGVKNIYSGYFLINDRSKRVQEKLGFKEFTRINLKTNVGEFESMVTRLTR